MPVDKWGHPFLYPSKTTAGISGSGTGFFWQQANDIRNDSNVLGMAERSGGGGVSDINTSTGEFTANYESSDSWTINKDPSFSSSIGGSDMNFAQTEARGYGYKADQPRDTELKVFAKFLDGRDDTGLSIGCSTGRHNESPSCQGFTYMFSIEGPNTSPQRFRFRKEMWHVNYDTDPKTGDWTHPLAPTAFTNVDHYIGLCCVRYNKKDGRGPGKDSVVLEAWINPDPDVNKNNWTMMKRTEDTGGWGDGGTDCNGEETQVGTWSNAVFRIKASDMTVRYKNCSLREIDPSLSFDDTPTTPPPTEQPGTTSEIQGLFKFQWDINQFRTSACAGAGVGGGGGGETGNARFYSVYTDQGVDSDKELSNTSTFDNRTRIVMSPVNSSSVFVGKKPRQVDIPLKKVGSPAATPTVRCKIYSSAGNVIYNSPTALDPSTLTTSYVKKIFDFSTNTHTLQVGDRIGVFYDTSSSSNYVVASYLGSSYPNTAYLQYENGVYDPKTRRLVMDVWE